MQKLPTTASTHPPAQTWAPFTMCSTGPLPTCEDTPACGPSKVPVLGVSPLFQHMQHSPQEQLVACKGLPGTLAAVAAQAAQPHPSTHLLAGPGRGLPRSLPASGVVGLWARLGLACDLLKAGWQDIEHVKQSRPAQHVRHGSAPRTLTLMQGLSCMGLQLLQALCKATVHPS